VQRQSGEPGVIQVFETREIDSTFENPKALLDNPKTALCV
jgi:hypothetical protein